MMDSLRTIFIYLPIAAGVVVLVALGLRTLNAPHSQGRRLLLAGLLVALALHAVFFLHTALSYVRFPYEQKSVVEGVIVYNAVQYLAGEQPYHDPAEAPFRSLNYPPVHEMALAGVMAVLGGPSLIGGRLFSLLCVLGTVVVAALATWRHTRSRAATFFGGIFFLCGYGLCQQWYEQVRNDALMVFLIVLGLYLAERAMARKKLPLAALVILLLALYTKQTAIFAVAATAGALWFHDRRQALIWSGIYAGCAIAVFLLMQIWSGGWFAFYLLEVPARAGTDWRQLNFAIELFLVTLPLTITAIVVIVRNLRAASSSEGVSVWALAFALGAPLCILQGIKQGATMNAFLPLLPLLSILCAPVLHRLLQDTLSRRWAPLLMLGVFLMQVAVLTYTPQLPRPAHWQAHERIAEWVRAAPGDVLVSWYSSHAYMNGKRYFGDPAVMSEMEKAGLWHGNEAIDKVDRGEFDLLILRPKIEPSDLAKAVARRYTLTEYVLFESTGIGGWAYMSVYVPKATPGNPAQSPAPE